ncbi:MAG: TetR/AcrR family transcriptional regulator [Myxococcota bacterium]
MKPSEPNRSPGRPLAFNPDDALDAAMNVFWLKGYEGASLSDLTAAMGINKPSLYAHFGNKRALFLAAIAHYNETVGAPKLQKLLEGNTVRETIATYFSTINTALTAPDTPPGCMVVSVATDLAGRDEEIRAQVAELLASTETFLVRRFEELGDAPMDERALAETVVSFGQSLAARARVGATKSELDARTERFLSVILRPANPHRSD